MPTILFLTHRLPYPPNKGDRIRTYHMLCFLARRANVWLGSLADESPQPEHLLALQPLCQAVSVAPLRRTRWLRALNSCLAGGTITAGAFYSPNLQHIVDSWAASVHFDACVASSSVMGQYLRKGPLREVPAIVDFMDVDSQKWRDYASVAHGPRRWVYRLEGKRLGALEREVCSWARGVTLVSEAEVSLLHAAGARGNITMVTNGVDLDFFRPEPMSEQSRTCVFVGAMDYLPNVDAACWFVDEVWPGVRKNCPEAKLRLVGRRPDVAVRRLADRPAVEVVGEVADVRPYLADAAVAVVPLRLARGVQNKVLEALAAGRPVVAAPPALVGLGTRALPVLKADDPAAWADILPRLLHDVGWRRQLGEEGRLYVEEYHSWERCLQPLAALLGLSG